MTLGYDLTEEQFDSENIRVTAECKSDGIICDTYATKSSPTEKGYWMQLVSGFEKYFINTPHELVPYVPKESENETITIKL